jgi:hypothetical protein
VRLLDIYKIQKIKVIKGKKKMKTHELVEMILEGQDLTEIIELNEYIPVLDKRNIALEILEECVEEEDGYLQVDQLKKHIYFTAVILREYAGIEFSYDFETMAYEYDELCEFGIIDEIMDSIFEDCERVKEILAFEESKILNRNSVEAQVARLSNSVAESLNNLSETIGKKVEELDVNKILPEGTDVNKLLDLLKLIK